MSDARIRRVDLGGPQNPSQGINPPIMTAQPTVPPPPVEASLINYLKSAFPVSLSKDATLRDYDRMYGQQELIRHLQQLVEAQQGAL